MGAETLDAGIPIGSIDSSSLPQNPPSDKIHFLYSRIGADVMDAGIPNYMLNMPNPQHAPPLKDYGLFLPANGHHNPLDEGNVIGNNNEVKAGILISNIDYVESVAQMEPGGPEDDEMIDLAVKMVEGHPIPFVNVQIKSSRRSIYDFFNRIGEMLDMEDQKAGVKRDKSDGDLEYQRRREWMKRHRLIVINAGFKGIHQMTEEYIVEKFHRELEEIIAYETTIQTQQIAA